MFIFVKAVGILPVSLAVFSLLFLVFLLSYHTLRKSFEQLELNKKEFIEIGKLLYTTANKLLKIFQEKGDFFNNHDKILSLAGTLHSEQIEPKEAIRANILLKKELEVLPMLVNNVSEITNNQEVKNILQEMQEVEQKYQVAYKKYAYNLKYYNNFVEKLPAKWVAQIIGYKKQ
ncbi:MAG: LemA family protein [Raineya sp.]